MGAHDRRLCLEPRRPRQRNVRCGRLPHRSEVANLSVAAIPPWCPGRGDPDVNGTFQFDSTYLQRYSYSYVSTGICPRHAPPHTFSAAYHMPSMRGGMLSRPSTLSSRALCFYPRDASTCSRSGCGFRSSRRRRLLLALLLLLLRLLNARCQPRSGRGLKRARTPPPARPLALPLGLPALRRVPAPVP